MKFMQRIGWSGKEWNRKIVEEGCKEVERKLMDLQENEQSEKLKIKICKKIDHYWKKRTQEGIDKKNS